jgi:hypothetical protein
MIADIIQNELNTIRDLGDKPSAMALVGGDEEEELPQNDETFICQGYKTMTTKGGELCAKECPDGLLYMKKQSSEIRKGYVQINFCSPLCCTRYLSV